MMRQTVTKNVAGGKLPDLPTRDAARILDNVFKACGMPPNTIPLEELEKKVQEQGFSLGETDKSGGYAWRN